MTRERPHRCIRCDGALMRVDPDGVERCENGHWERPEPEVQTITLGPGKFVLSNGFEGEMLSATLTIRKIQ